MIQQARRIARTLLAIVLTLATGAASAARGETLDDTGEWMALFAQGDLAACETLPIKWWFDGHLRFLDDTDGFNQSIVRPGLGCELNEYASVWAGYAWIHTTPIVGDSFDEHRVWQQLTWSREIAPYTFALRPRLEQRFLETGDDVGWRFRQLVRAQHNLPQLPRLSLVAWDEVFFNLNNTDWGAANGFDQNRVFAGFGWKPSTDKPWRAEIGYLNQTIDIPHRDNRSHHILSVNLYH